MVIRKDRRRRVVGVVAVLLVAGLAGATVHRVLAPAEVVTVARGELPAVASPASGPIGRFATAPLLVDGRLRVYATTRQVWADAPVDDRQRNTPYWSYRRWPAQLSGVVTGGATVVSRWSDGQLVALHAHTGRIAWRAAAPAPPDGYTGRRTGASTVWTPVGLHTATTPDGRPVVVTVGDRQAQGSELTTGRRLWRVDLDPGCRTAIGTTVTGRLATLDRCADGTVVEFRDAATGAVVERWRPPGAAAASVVTPTGCATARSACGGLRVAEPETTGADPADGRGWLVDTGSPVAAPGLDRTGAVLAGPAGVAVTAGVVTGRSARTGDELWRRTDLGPGVRVLGAQPGRVHLLTEEKDLVTLDPATGVLRSRFRLTVGRDGTGWTPGLAYAADGYLAVERLRTPVDVGADDHRYYPMAEPVVLAAT
ncbi:PQQ-binding-like beta-propeller repeat protein [Micromonospora sp. WMMD882]|uniref:outer membrane protein assembly factor BamB family protein n=1 Tax=Micromonospora sp. WMMD882 TaxID=3015151 RepID=UPI00248C7E33|nr:PQQ-binding-like beta-propeller repeat protein [Micromonospora sp. WMMD882]WBB78905.1 PQQ-binding-like beta-propeller repeat protein [Micromonospora sp. WMMD882]